MNNSKLRSVKNRISPVKRQRPPPKNAGSNLRDHRIFEAALKWQDKLVNGPRYQGIIDVFSTDPYCAAFRVSGIHFMRMLLNLARKGHKDSLRQLLFHVYEAVESLEKLSERQPDILREFARRRADWPVMLSRHESSTKLVSSYLDRIQLGADCLINADGLKPAKYSLRTPINRYVWHELKRLPWSLILLSDMPEIAAIHLETLPKLTKATAKIWADQALMPYICAIHKDFLQVPAFQSILSRSGVKTRGQQKREIRKDIIRSLQSLARNSMAQNPHVLGHAAAAP